MGNIAIEAEGIGKKYRIGLKKQAYYTFRETLVESLKAPLRRFRRLSGGAISEKEEFWALRDVSFTVKHGEVVGIIGRNGAGKSTLLKILSRITRPTTGEARVYGRVGSLLEVGTGFHPELTGRENIFLNGSVLGMTRAEINRKFDEIVDFSGVEDFLDTPVKRYSSGMAVRLGFSVAAHLDPEILVVDEVLAVGDAEFQKKCLGKMEGIAREGRTVLFVSHNMAAINNLCPRALLVDKGNIIDDGQAKSVVERYLSNMIQSTTSLADLRDHPSRHRGSTKVLRRIELFGSNGAAFSIPIGGQVSIRIQYKAPHAIEHLKVGIIVEDCYGSVIAGLAPNYLQGDLDASVPSQGTLECTIPHLDLLPGTYFVSVGFADLAKGIKDYVSRAMTLEVAGSSVYPFKSLPRTGIVYMESHWSRKACPPSC